MIKKEEATPFPIEAFPPKIRGIVAGLEVAFGYPREYTSAALLVAFATAMGNNFELEVKRGWREKAILYCALVGNAGANKTHPMNFALAPLIGRDHERVSLARAAANRGEEPITPERLCVSDVTQESLVKLLLQNPRGLLLCIDELKAWINNFSRYSSGSQEQFWLSNFSRSPILVDRKSEALPISISDPFISVLGSTQPSVLSSFASGDKGSNGFVDRMLFVVRRSTDKPYWSSVDIDPKLEQTWRNVLISALNVECRYTLSFSREAMVMASGWQVENTDLLNSPENAHLSGPFSKLEIYFVRFCLIMRVLRYFSSSDIEIGAVGPEDVEAAIAIAEYFRAQIIEAQELLYPEVERHLTQKQLRFYDALPDTFTKAQAAKVAKALGYGGNYSYNILRQWEGYTIGFNELGEYYKL
ncbi:MAG: DUF3987 domain-containing protein [Rikenellaceae bacterium]